MEAEYWRRKQRPEMLQLPQGDTEEEEYDQEEKEMLVGGRRGLVGKKGEGGSEARAEKNGKVEFLTW